MDIEELKRVLEHELEALADLADKLEKAARKAQEDLLIVRGRHGQTQAILNKLAEADEKQDKTGADTE